MNLKSGVIILLQFFRKFKVSSDIFPFFETIIIIGIQFFHQRFGTIQQMTVDFPNKICALLCREFNPFPGIKAFQPEDISLHGHFNTIWKVISIGIHINIRGEQLDTMSSQNLLCQKFLNY